MAILDKCNECGRLGGYAAHAGDKVCARCILNQLLKSENEKKNEDD